MRKRAISAALAVIATLIAPHAHAWGNDGHRIVGYIASSLLDDSVRQRLHALLGDEDLAGIATQLDEQRDVWERRFPGASKWHYENRAICSSQISCPQGQCVTRQIENHLQTLRDPRASREKRTEALTIVVHLVADLHQPLHLTDNRDRGGNDVWVLMPREREPRRLHEVWDTRLIRLGMQRRSAPSYSELLLRQFESRKTAWTKGTTETWAAETHRIGRESAYLTLPGFSCTIDKQNTRTEIELSSDYVESAQKVAAEQLAKAGVRLAAVLNTALAERARR